MTDCLIIGGGIIGMLTARELLNAGLSVTLIDQSTTGRESSWAGGGIISPLYPWRYVDSVNRLASWSQSHYEALCLELFQASGVDPEYTRSGLLILEPGDNDLALAWAAENQQTMSRLEPLEMAQIETALHTDAKSALWMQQVAQVRNPRLAKAARGAIEGRITILEHTQALDLAAKNGQIEGVNTNLGLIKAGNVVVCAGAWSGRLMHDYLPAPDIVPVLGQMLMFKSQPGAISSIVLHNERYVIPRRDGRVLVGSTLEHKGFDKTTTQEARQALKAFALAHFPLLGDAEIEHQWAGLRPGSPKGIPYICPVPAVQGLFINAGHFRNGVVLAPASARLMADLITGAEPIVNPVDYAIDASRD